MSDETEPKYAPAIDNDSSRYQVLSLSKLRLPPEIKRPQSEHGPFVVQQQGSMPGDPHSKPHDFLLTKEGLWLPLFAFIKLPTQERDELCIFSTAAEAVQQLEELAGTPAIMDAERVARALHIELPPTPPDEPDAPV
jgi:hypothetical protein